MRRSFINAALVVFVSLGSVFFVTAYAASALRLGLLPYISPQQLIETYKPLKSHLELTLKRPVILVTTRNFSEFLRAAEHLDYDIYHAPPHFSLLAEQDYHYRRLAKFSTALYGSVLVRSDSQIHEPKQLRGRMLAMPDALAAVTFLGEGWLRSIGLTPGQDVRIQYLVSHANALRAVLNHTADAAILSPALLYAMPPAERGKLRELAKTNSVANTMFMASPKMNDDDYRRVSAALLSFTADGPGKVFFDKTGFGDIDEITDDDMMSSNSLVALLKQRVRGK
ncbi:MAG: phosphate/phosphite/phosphonate ABC transporter substrate-binding protein [Pseudomonadota bacterium]